MADLNWIFGPNGAGKTTFADTFLDIEHVNVDLILLTLIERSYPGIISKLKANPTEWWIQDMYLTELENNLDRARNMALTRINELLDQNESFSVESNFLPSESETFFLKAIHKGYKINFIYVALPSIEMCINRVLERTALTGQYVSDTGINDRFNKGIQEVNDLLEPGNKLIYKKHINFISIISGENLDDMRDILFIFKGVLRMYDSKLIKDYSSLIPALKIFDLRGKEL
jgi:predicted ABC-type ATPase